MDNLVDKTYVHAKINALHGYLLSEGEYQEIARSGKIHAAFPGILTEKDTSDAIRTKEIIFRHHIEKFILFIGLSGFYGEFFKSFLLLFELSNIKHVLLRAYGKSQLFPQWNDVAPYGIIDARYREKNISLDELKSIFNGTVLSEAMSFAEPPPYEVLESRIDFLALKNLTRFSSRLHPADQMYFNEMLTRKIISIRIIWDSRRRKHYGTENDFPQFNPMDILAGTTVRADEIERIEKEMAGRIAAGHSGAGVQGAPPDSQELELLLNRLFMSYVNKIFFRDFHSICPVMAYAWSVYYQILNLFAIIEGFQLKADPAIIVKHVAAGV